MSAIPDFTEAEYKLAAALLFDRYGKLVPVQLADSELCSSAPTPRSLSSVLRSTGTNAAHTSSCAKQEGLPGKVLTKVSIGR